MKNTGHAHHRTRPAELTWLFTTLGEDDMGWIFQNPLMLWLQWSNTIVTRRLWCRHPSNGWWGVVDQILLSDRSGHVDHPLWLGLTWSISLGDIFDHVYEIFMGRFASSIRQHNVQKAWNKTRKMAFLRILESVLHCTVVLRRYCW